MSSPTSQSETDVPLVPVSDTLNWLTTPTRTVPILPGHDHTLLHAEELVLQTTALQRMRKLRQMGMAYHEYPLAEHTRYLHSLGTSYWATKMFDGLTRSTGDLLRSNHAIVSEMRRVLGKELSLELVLRLYSIIHDIALLPLGHTLRIQSQRFNTSDFIFEKLFGGRVSDILDEIEILNISEKKKLLLKKHLVVAEAVGHAPRIFRDDIHHLKDTLFQRISFLEATEKLPVLCFAYDLVHGVCAADLLDWCHRDISAIGIQNDIPAYPFSAGAAIKVNPGDRAFPINKANIKEPVFRYGLDCSEESGWGLNALFRLASLHKLRVEVILRGNYSGQKTVADAVLDKSIRLIEAATGEPIESGISAGMVLTMGDDEFLTLLGSKLNALDQTKVTDALQNPHHYENVIEMKESDFGPGFTRRLTTLASSEERSGLEGSLAQFLNARYEDVIVSVTPKDMQGKVPDTIVNVGDFGWQPLWMLACSSHLIPDLRDLKDAYVVGARISVILRKDVVFEKRSLNGFLKKLLEK